MNHIRRSKRILTSLTLSLAAGLIAVAHNAVKMTRSDNTETIFVLSHHPTVSFENGALLVKTDSQKLTVELDTPVSFTFVETASGFETVAADTPVFRIDSSHLEAFNLEPEQLVVIHDISGKTVAASTTDRYGYVSISIAHLQAGVYIVSSSKTNFKFHKQ